MDSAQNRPFPSYTTAQLKAQLVECYNEAKAAEIARREKVAAGDLSVATPSERLRLQK
jgi:hypothetical protein